MKNCLQTFIGSAVYHTKITLKGLCGLLLVVCGSGAYAIERINTTECKEEGKDIEKIQLIDSNTKRDGGEEEIKVSEMKL